jgi:ABC-type lipoprotein export system ATPase subunit
MAEEVLRIDQVSKTYRAKGRAAVTALHAVDLRLGAGTIRVIVGPSGSGKSSLLLCAGGLLRPDAGTVTLAGQDLYSLSAEERSAARARDVGFVFQQFHLVPFLNVLDNVLTPMLAGVGGGDLRARADSLVERFGLGPRRLHPTAELSVGECQRVALARALLLKPKVLLADEPTGNLDEENGGRVIDALTDYAAAGGAVLVVTHDRRLETGEYYRLEGGTLHRAAAAPATDRPGHDRSPSA